MGYKVLIADDEMEIRNLLRLYLENDGFEVMEAASGDAVMPAMKGFKPDIILLDVVMPIFNGIEAAQEIRTFDKT